MSDEEPELVYKLQTSWNNLNVPKFVLISSAFYMAEHLVLHPVDVIRTKLQVKKEFSSKAIANIIRSSGLKGLYTAYWTSLGYLPGNAVYFSVYCFAKDRLQSLHNKWYPQDNNKNQAPWVSFVAGTAADVSAVLLYCPVEIVQQRLYLQDPTNKVYRNAPDAFVKIFKTDGIRGLYRGMMPLLLNSLPASAIWWTIYEIYVGDASTDESKGKISAQIDLYKTMKQESSSHVEHAVVVKQHPAAQFIAGAVAGCLTTIITNPLDVVRTRLQTQHLTNATTEQITNSVAEKLNTSMVSAIKDVYQCEGIRGFARGMTMRTIQWTWMSCVGALFYELAVDLSRRE